MVDINEFTRETTCEYKGELYSVRDNGSVMRHKREGKKSRKLDDVWTFGTKDKTSGYMMINSHRVHIIVAKAFIPGNKDDNMVVDHIDTNRCNNRVENLRWLTRLENVLLNEVTLKRVTYLCGGDINKFINDPSCLRGLASQDKDIMWMRTVTKEEAKKAWEHISTWAKRPIPSFKMTQYKEKIKDFDEWLKVHDSKDTQPPQMFHALDQPSIRLEEEQMILDNRSLGTNFLKDGMISHLKSQEGYIQERNSCEKEEDFCIKKSESFTNGAFQIDFPEKLHFPLCPKNGAKGLEDYAKNLQEGLVIANSENGDEYSIISMGWTCEWDAIQVEVKMNGRKAYFVIYITFENGKYIHSKGECKPYYRFCDSPNVLQCNANTRCFFSLCPKEGNITLEEYANILQKDILFEENQYCKGYVFDREITQSETGDPILYVGVKMEDSFKKYADMIIFIERGKVIHQIGRTYFDEKSLERTFCKIRGQEWDDNIEVFDDCC